MTCRRALTRAPASRGGRHSRVHVRALQPVRGGRKHTVHFLAPSGGRTATAAHGHLLHPTRIEALVGGGWTRPAPWQAMFDANLDDSWAVRLPSAQLRRRLRSRRQTRRFAQQSGCLSYGIANKTCVTITRKSATSGTPSAFPIRVAVCDDTHLAPQSTLGVEEERARGAEREPPARAHTRMPFPPPACALVVANC